MSIAAECCVCYAPFELRDHFEIRPGRKMGVQCNSGHAICNICFMRMYPRKCPLCQMNMGGAQYDFPSELDAARREETKAYQDLKNQLEDCELVIATQQEELSKLPDLQHMVTSQNAMLLSMQLFSDGALEHAFQNLPAISSPVQQQYHGGHNPAPSRHWDAWNE